MVSPSGIPPQSFACVGSEPTSVGRPTKRKRTEESKPTLNTLPEDLHYRIFCRMLDLPEHCRLRVVSRHYNKYIGGDWPLYQHVLAACSRGGAPVPPGATCAARINAAVLGGHRECMSYLAEELTSSDLCGRTRVIVTRLFDESVADLTHPSWRTLFASRMRSLWRRQLTGQPPTSLSDGQLVRHHLVLETRAQHIPAFSTHLNLQVLLCAVWGFCSEDNKRGCLRAAIITAAAPGLTPQNRRKFEIQRDLLWYLLAADPVEQGNTWNSCQEHLDTVEGQQGLESLGLTGFVTLLEQQRRLVGSQPMPKNDADIAKNLVQLRGDVRHSLHLRALANLTLAYQRLHNRTHAITDEEACTFLRGLAARQYLRDQVRNEAQMLLQSFHLLGRYPGTHFTDSELAQCARMILNTGITLPDEHCLLLNRDLWAKNVLVRLKIDHRVDAISLQTAIAFAQSLSTEPTISHAQRQFHLGAISLFWSRHEDSADPVDVEDADADAATRKVANEALENSEPDSPSRIKAILVLAKLSLRALAQGRPVDSCELASIRVRLPEVMSLNDSVIASQARRLYYSLDTEGFLSTPDAELDFRRFCRLLLREFP